MYSEKKGLGFIDRHKERNNTRKLTIVVISKCHLHFYLLRFEKRRCVLQKLEFSSAHSNNKLLLIDLPLLHVVVELLLLIL
jgi:hypothetical protein